MKKILIYMIGVLLATPAAIAQPSWTKKAIKSVFTLKTFSADGTLIGSTNGVFVGEQGECISSFAPFKGASSAIVIDSQGKEMPVSYMLGANDTYDVAKFKVSAKKTMPLTLCSSSCQENVSVWLLPYRDMKNVMQGTVRKAETFKEQFAYYTIAMNMPEGTTGCPLMNEAGEVVGLMQQPYKQNDTLSYAVSALYADSLVINGLSINDPVLKSTKIKKDLPPTLNQAVFTLYLAQASLDSASYRELLEDFIVRFPNAPDGYTYRAQLEVNSKNFSAAAQDMEQAVNISENKDEAHFNYSKLIYQKEIYMNQEPYKEWSLEKALEEARLAESINPLPVYSHQQAVILYAQKKFHDASDIYQKLFNTEMRSAELFFEASRCKAMLGDTIGQIALLDSCMAMFSKPYLKEAAPYLLAHAQTLMDAKRYREATIDLNDYEQLMQATVNANFYHLRYQAEVGGRLFQQALNDIDRAIQMEPQYDLYYAEKASLQVRVGMTDEAIETALKCIEMSPDYSDGYLFLGIAQCLKGQKDEGLKNLRKAKELGDQQADDLIEKYSK